MFIGTRLRNALGLAAIALPLIVGCDGGGPGLGDGGAAGDGATGTTDTGQDDTGPPDGGMGIGTKDDRAKLDL
jgi:hypothetical protein